MEKYSKPHSEKRMWLIKKMMLLSHYKKISNKSDNKHYDEKFQAII